ncbi:MAG: HD domain-containing protein [Candidatus Pacebacteria bacterium]|nr:HD domain-containing protein [Candidatus Paceibacterota bacterium]
MRDIKFALPPAVQKILSTLHTAGFDGYIVGGAVRDVLLDKPVKDWDFTTNATPEQIQKLFPDSFYDNQFGTVGIAGKHLNDKENPEAVYEITTYRSEGLYTDHRRPDSVTWGKTVEEDLQRRDFTINAMALGENKIIDPYHGQDDIKNHVIRAVGDPSMRFQEDALRMMRAVRIGAQLGFAVEQLTIAAITQNAHLLEHISWERIRDEFLKILVSDYPEEGIQLLASTNLLKHILPELLECRGVQQAHHHIYDVWTHTLKAVNTCPSKDPIVRLAVLLHDIAKPLTADTSSGTVTFYNHEVLGARVARKVAERFRLSKKDIQRVFMLVRWHMFVYDPKVTDAYIRRFIRRVGVEYISDMIALRVADRVGSGATATSWRLEEMQKRIEGQLQKTFSMNDMAIDGNDLMKEFGLRPGPEVGKLLKMLFKDVVEHPEHNTKEYLMEKAKKLL